MYTSLWNGGRVGIVTPKLRGSSLTDQIFLDLQLVRPTVLKGVPTFWERSASHSTWPCPCLLLPHYTLHERSILWCHLPFSARRSQLFALYSLRMVLGSVVALISAPCALFPLFCSLLTSHCNDLSLTALICSINSHCFSFAVPTLTSRLCEAVWATE